MIVSKITLFYMEPLFIVGSKVLAANTKKAIYRIFFTYLLFLSIFDWVVALISELSSLSISAISSGILVFLHLPMVPIVGIDEIVEEYGIVGSSLVYFGSLILWALFFSLIHNFFQTIQRRSQRRRPPGPLSNSPAS